MRLFSIRPGITIAGRTFKGIRGWAGKPSHPPLTDFPIVCYVLAAAFDVISFVAEDGSDVARDFYRAGTFVIVAGLIVSLGTALTGFWDWWKGLERGRSSGPIGRASHTQVWRTANWHMAIMLTVTAIVIGDVALRVSDFQGSVSALVAVLSILAALLVALGAAYGGAMVFDYQFNVEPLKGSTVWNETDVDQLPGQRTAPPPA
ncbi:MAG: DUF2231 domain-containing protein [Actinomycetota bacterium]